MSDNEQPMPLEALRAKSYEVLEGLEPVRKRPGMYLGALGTRGYLRMISGVVEAVCEWVDAIEEGQSPHLFLSHDIGEGLAVLRFEWIARVGSTGSRSGNPEKLTSLGSGLGIANALSTRFDLSTNIPGVEAHWSFAFGEPRSTPGKTVQESPARSRFIQITLNPDTKILGELSFEQPHYLSGYMQAVLDRHTGLIDQKERH